MRGSSSHQLPTLLYLLLWFFRILTEYNSSECALSQVSASVTTSTTSCSGVFSPETIATRCNISLASASIAWLGFSESGGPATCSFFIRSGRNVFLHRGQAFRTMEWRQLIEGGRTHGCWLETRSSSMSSPETEDVTTCDGVRSCLGFGRDSVGSQTNITYTWGVDYEHSITENERMWDGWYNKNHCIA